MNKYKLISFDMDGTLTLGTTCLQYYVKKLNQENKAKELEDLYRNNVIDDYEIADKYAEILKGIDRKLFDKWTGEIPRMKNIKEAINVLKSLGFVVGITSVGPIFSSEYFKVNFGFDFASGSEHKFINGIHSGEMIHTLTGKDKVTILERISKNNKIKMTEIIAIGDSRSDIPIFERVGFKIALNADENLKNNTDLFIKSDNLLDVSTQIKNLCH